MNIRKIEHVGIAVRSAEAARDFYAGRLDLAAVSDETIDEMKLRIVKIEVGETVLELLEPLAGEAVISRFLDKRGEGIHHICFGVDDVAAATGEAGRRGCRVLWEEPRRGAGGRRVNFLHPVHGVLIEFNEPRRNA